MNRLSIFSHMVSVRPSHKLAITHGKQNACYMRENNERLLAGAVWVTLRSPELYFDLFK